MYILAKRPVGSEAIPEFGVKPVVHSQQLNAELEAARLARLALGYEFLVYGPIRKVCAEQPRLQWEDMS